MVVVENIEKGELKSIVRFNVEKKKQCMEINRFSKTFTYNKNEEIKKI